MLTTLREGPQLEAFIKASLDRQLLEQGPIQPHKSHATEYCEAKTKFVERAPSAEKSGRAGKYPYHVRLAAIGKAHGFEPGRLLSVHKDRKHAAARQHAMIVYRLVRLADWHEIADLFGISVKGVEQAWRRWQERRSEHAAAEAAVQEFIAAHEAGR